MKTTKFLFVCLLSTIVLTACSSDDDSPAPVNEEEVITTLILELTPRGTGNIVTLETRDLDGDGPDDPIITVSGPLSANTIYDGSISVLNETETPVEDKTSEILEEDEEHQFFFSTTNNVASVSYNDSDSNGNPIGLNFTLETTGAATGTLTVILLHEPNKDAAGVSDGDDTNAGGETDIEATFSISVVE